MEDVVLTNFHHLLSPTLLGDTSDSDPQVGISIPTINNDMMTEKMTEIKTPSAMFPFLQSPIPLFTRLYFSTPSKPLLKVNSESTSGNMNSKWTQD
jgi:hypothetical protein